MKKNSFKPEYTHTNTTNLKTPIQNSYKHTFSLKILKINLTKTFKKFYKKIAKFYKKTKNMSTSSSICEQNFLYE